MKPMILMVSFCLGCLNGEPQTFQIFAEDYYEIDMPLSAIRYVISCILPFDSGDY